MKMDQQEDAIQFDPQNISARLVLHGKDADNGIIGLQDTVEALQGFQHYFQDIAGYYAPEIKSPDFTLPISLSKGSLITEIANYWWTAPVIVGSSWFAKAFLTKLGERMGEKASEYLFPPDCKNEFSKNMQKIPFLLYRIIVIGKHLNGIGAVALSMAKIQPVANGNWQLENKHGEKLEITEEERKIFEKLDPKICSQLVTPVRSRLQLQYSYLNKNNQVGGSVDITDQDKEFFYFPEDDDDEKEIILPELENEHYYELEGEINRVTEKTCSLGFFYKGHTISSIPVDRQLAPYKSQFLSTRNNRVFGRVRISGIIRRQDSSTGFMKNRPIMHFDKLELLEEFRDAELF